MGFIWCTPFLLQLNFLSDTLFHGFFGDGLSGDQIEQRHAHRFEKGGLPFFWLYCLARQELTHGDYLIHGQKSFVQRLAQIAAFLASKGKIHIHPGKQRPQAGGILSHGGFIRAYANAAFPGKKGAVIREDRIIGCGGRDKDLALPGSFFGRGAESDRRMVVPQNFLQSVDKGRRVLCVGR